MSCLVESGVVYVMHSPRMDCVDIHATGELNSTL